MRQKRALALGLLASALIAPPSPAMLLDRIGADLYAKGRIDAADFPVFQAQLARPGLSRLILVNSPGGNAWTALRMAEMVRDAHLDTVVSGRCLSACSLLFVAGKRRHFGTGNPPHLTLIGIHGVHDRNTRQLLPETGAPIAAFYRERLGNSLNAGVLRDALFNQTDDSGLLVIPEMQRTRASERDARLCPSLRDRNATCRPYPGQTALSLGLVTDARTLALRLPRSMRLEAPVQTPK